MRRLCLIGCFMLCSLAITRAEQLSPYLCDENLSPVVANDSPVLLPYVTLMGTTLGADGSLTFINTSDKKILYYLVVMEFSDSQGNYLFSAPVYNVDEKRQIPFEVPFKEWLIANWPGGYMEAIPARSKSREVFGTHLVALTCPTSVRATAIWLKFEDGTEYKHVSKNLNLSPATRKPVKFKNIKQAKTWGPVTVVGNIKLDEQGRVTSTKIESPNERFKTWLTKEISGWEFTSPWVSGKPASVTLPFLFIFANNADARTEAEAMKKQGIQGPILLLSFRN